MVWVGGVLPEAGGQCTSKNMTSGMTKGVPMCVVTSARGMTKVRVCLCVL